MEEEEKEIEKERKTEPAGISREDMAAEIKKAVDDAVSAAIASIKEDMKQESSTEFLRSEPSDNSEVGSYSDLVEDLK